MPERTIYTWMADEPWRLTIFLCLPYMSIGVLIGYVIWGVQ